MYIKTGDLVQVIAGRERGKTGKVTQVDLRRNRVFIDGLNIVKRHKKPNPVDTEGGIIEKAASLHASNVLLYSEKLERGVRVSYRFLGEGDALFVAREEAKSSFAEPPNRVRKVRLCVKTGEVFR